MRPSSWTSWLGIVAIVLGVLATADYGTELTRQFVMSRSAPADGQLPAAVCPADELEEEGLSAAECRQLVSNVRNQIVSAAEWFTASMTVVSLLATTAAITSVAAGAGLLLEKRWAVPVSLGSFGALAVLDTAGFVAALNAGPILRGVYLWDALLWLALHLMMTVAAAAGRAAQSVPASAEPAAKAAPDRPTSGTGFTRAVTWSHVFVAVSVFFLFASSWWMLALPLPSADFTFRAFPFQLHKNLGITVFLLVGVMLYARFRRPPQPSASRWLPVWMHRLAMLDHVLLYGLLAAVSISGYMSSSYSGWSTTLWWLVDLPHWGHENEALNIFWSDVHLWTCWALLAVIAGHVCGALFHAFRADGFVQRMLRP